MCRQYQNAKLDNIALQIYTHTLKNTKRQKSLAKRLLNYGAA
jgi:hypothetical protein